MIMRGTLWNLFDTDAQETALLDKWIRVLHSGPFPCRGLPGDFRPQVPTPTGQDIPSYRPGGESG